MNRRQILQSTGLALAATTLPLRARRAIRRQEIHRAWWQHGDESLALALHRQPSHGDMVLYLHGATFPAALSVAWRMEGVSWMDSLQDAGFDAWALDFAGFGDSDRPQCFHLPSEATPAFGTCPQAAGQIAAAIAYLRGLRPDARLHLVAHSWGTLPAQMAAIAHSREVSRLVLFGPVVPRDGLPTARPGGAWALVDEAAQRPRQRTGLPADVPTPVSEAEIDRWCRGYLASDPESATRTPPAAKVPNGPALDVTACWQGQALVDSTRVEQPVLVVRGEWDHVTTDEDARRLFAALRRSADRRDVKISGGNHWLHLQPRRTALWAESIGFLSAPG